MIEALESPVSADVLANRLAQVFEDAIVTNEKRDGPKHLLGYCQLSGPRVKQTIPVYGVKPRRQM